VSRSAAGRCGTHSASALRLQRRGTAGLFALAFLALAGACRQDMHDQPKYKPLRASEIFADKRSARPLVEGTVARGTLREDAGYYTGKTKDGFVTELPVPMNAQLLERGQSQFQVFCSPCHGRTGRGDGMIVRRGFKQPSSYHVDRLRQMPIGYFFDVMTIGFGAMPDYAAQIAPADRWAIAAYVRTLQLSQHAPASALAADERAQLDRSLDPGQAAAPEHHP
jgi:mono/diheme cytochrome c family protein